MEEAKSASKILTGIPIGNRPLGRFRHRWEGNIRIDLKKIGVNMINWIHLVRKGIIGTTRH